MLGWEFDVLSVQMLPLVHLHMRQFKFALVRLPSASTHIKRRCRNRRVVISRSPTGAKVERVVATNQTTLCNVSQLVHTNINRELMQPIFLFSPHLHQSLKAIQLSRPFFGLPQHITTIHTLESPGSYLFLFESSVSTIDVRYCELTTCTS
jgi:hypothetical protein